MDIVTDAPRIEGDVSRVDCDITPESQGLSTQLYKLVCGDDGSGGFESESKGSLFAAQRRAEIEIINDKLMTDPPYFGWRFRSFDEDSLVILDCPRAFGGICVINAWSERYIHITSFRPTKPNLRNEIFIQPRFFLEHQTPNFTMEGELREEVNTAETLIRQSRYVFDHPEMQQNVVETVAEGINSFIQWFSHNV